MLRVYTLILLLALLLIDSAVYAAEVKGKVKPAHYVFANYCVCFASYGETIEGYQREIREAQAVGIDGFVLDCGAWQNEAHYPRRVKLMFQAAQELGTGFKYFFELYGGFQNIDYIMDAVKTFGHHPNYFTQQGRLVLSTWGLDDVPWKEKVLDPLRQQGYDIFFVPAFYARPDGKAIEMPTYAMQKVNVANWATLVDGLFFWGASGTAEQMSASNAATTRALHEAGKLSMASVSPNYWGSTQNPDRRYFEDHGCEGTAMQWASIIKTQPEWVELLTWNDWMEGTYLCPVADPAKYFAQLEDLRRYPHGGFLAFNAYYIKWYKSGKQPKITKDALYYVYRTHAKDAIAGADKPVLKQVGEVKDELNISTMLTAPAELHVFSGTTEQTFPLKKGITHLRVPFACGAQRFEVYRKGKCILKAEGDPIQQQIIKYNYFLTSGAVSQL